MANVMTTNIANVQRCLASIRGEIFATERVGFNMATTVQRGEHDLPDRSGRGCEWVGSLAGHAALLATGKTVQEIEDMDILEVFRIARDYLGLTPDQAEELFYAFPDDVTPEDITLEQTAHVVDRLRNTGAVSWK